MAIGQVIGFGLAVLSSAVPLRAQDMRPPPRPERPVPEAAVVLSSKSPAPRPIDLLVGHEMRFALSAARGGDWDGAGTLAANRGDLAAGIIEWQRLRAGRGTFDDYMEFLAQRGDWPGLALLRRKGEATIPESATVAQVIAYFDGRAPQTGYGALRLAVALRASEQAEVADAVIIRAWTELDLDADAEAAFVQDHGALLKPHHAARLDRLLWDGERRAAGRMLQLVGTDWQALAQARIALQKKLKGVDALIAAVPKTLAGDPGLAFDRMTWRIGQRQRDAAADLMLKRSSSVETLGRPERWADWRRILARQEMRSGHGARAYALASAHHLTEGKEFADLEWLSGYLSLRYLDDPAQALVHFRRFRGAVFTPISLGRAGYWEGRALEALGQGDAALVAYTDAGQYQTSFYGLLAAEKARLPMDTSLTGRAGRSNWRHAAFARTEVFRAAGLFFNAGQPWEAGWFLRHLATGLAPADLVPLTEYTLSLGDPNLAVRVGKRAAREGVVVARAYFPLTRLEPGALAVPEELTLSIARRESEFRAGAVSGVGARGLMQLMPATARAMAGRLGLPYSRARLTGDPAYNVRLGGAYLAQLTEKYGHNYVLVAAGYNAGPHRVDRWIEANGDPRTADVDAVDWIEHIPYRETRNYVMRVMESLPVYRARLSGVTEPIRLSAELKAR